MTCCSDRGSGDKDSGVQVPVVAHVAWAAVFGQELYILCMALVRSEVYRKGR